MKLNQYDSRLKAGGILAEYVLKNSKSIKESLESHQDDFFCFAIPNGGVPVAEGFCNQFKIRYDIIIVRKIKIPFNTEAGFGSITPDGTILMNEPLLQALNLTKSQIDNAINITKSEISERLQLYKKQYDLQELYAKLIKSRYIFIMDDGLASGFTMLAAIQMIKKYEPDKIYIAVPTAPFHTVIEVQKKVDEIFCPNVRNTTWFAVADAYKNWYDVPESEVLEIIKNSNYYYSNI